MENVRKFIPECLREFKIDWSKYTPAGGWEWQEAFHSESIPELERRIRELRSSVSDTRTFQMERKEFLRCLGNVRMTLDKVGGRIGGSIDSSLAKWIRDAPANIDAIVSGLSEKDSGDSEIMEAESEIVFLDAVIRYFTLDLEFDMLMWALYEIPVRNRTRVFRTAARLLVVVMDAKNIVDNARGETDDATRGRLARPLAYLAVGYSKMPLVIRSIRKQIDKKGELAWSDGDFVQSARLRNQCADSRGESCNWSF